MLKRQNGNNARIHQLSYAQLNNEVIKLIPRLFHENKLNENNFTAT